MPRLEFDALPVATALYKTVLLAQISTSIAYLNFHKFFGPGSPASYLQDLLNFLGSLHHLFDSPLP